MLEGLLTILIYPRPCAHRLLLCRPSPPAAGWQQDIARRYDLRPCTNHFSFTPDVLNAVSTPMEVCSWPIIACFLSASSPTMRQKGSAPKAYCHGVDIYLTCIHAGWRLIRHTTYRQQLHSINQSTSMTSNQSPEAQEQHTDPKVAHDPSKPTAAEPYSIFDKRQKALIVAIASIAATCE